MKYKNNDIRKYFKIILSIESCISSNKFLLELNNFNIISNYN